MDSHSDTEGRTGPDLSDRLSPLTPQAPSRGWRWLIPVGLLFFASLSLLFAALAHHVPGGVNCFGPTYPGTHRAIEARQYLWLAALGIAVIGDVVGALGGWLWEHDWVKIEAVALMLLTVWILTLFDEASTRRMYC
jgi:hypothetical protein